LVATLLLPFARKSLRRNGDKQNEAKRATTGIVPATLAGLWSQFPRPDLSIAALLLLALVVLADLEARHGLDLVS
jgi:hypothetical protein